MSGDPAQLGYIPPVTAPTNQPNLHERMDMLLENKNAMIYRAEG